MGKLWGPLHWFSQALANPRINKRGLPCLSSLAWYATIHLSDPSLPFHRSVPWSGLSDQLAGYTLQQGFQPVHGLSSIPPSKAEIFLSPGDTSSANVNGISTTFCGQQSSQISYLHSFSTVLLLPISNATALYCHLNPTRRAYALVNHTPSVSWVSDRCFFNRRRLTQLT